MVLGRFAAAGRRMAVGRHAASFAPRFGGARGAAQVASPKPLSFRMDGLMAQCLVAAVIYFVPQDAVFLTGLFYKWHTDATSIAPKKRQSDAEAALEDFKAKKGLGDVKVEKGRSTWYVSM